MCALIYRSLCAHKISFVQHFTRRVKNFGALQSTVAVINVTVSATDYDMKFLPLNSNIGRV